MVMRPNPEVRSLLREPSGAANACSRWASRGKCPVLFRSGSRSGIVWTANGRRSRPLQEADCSSEISGVRRRRRKYIKYEAKTVSNDLMQDSPVSPSYFLQMELSENALAVLRARYLLKDESGNLTETTLTANFSLPIRRKCRQCELSRKSCFPT
jgi:hypothetical protein